MYDLIQTKFIYWYNNEFKFTQLYQDMAETVEDSPWHREENVGVHTDMVVSQYLMLAGHSAQEHFWKLGAFGCAFHDVGKPASEVVKFKEERGHYRAYHGHEMLSARMWESWAVENFDMLQERFKFTPEDIYTVTWMIEHHVPWAIKKTAKLQPIAATMANTFEVFFNAWYEMLKADQFGRMSDSSNQRLAEVNQWMCDFDQLAMDWLYTEHEVYSETHIDVDTLPTNNRAVYVLIGAPCSGKSSKVEELKGVIRSTGSCWEIVSMDQCRLNWYGTDNYSEAFEAACADPEFDKRVMAKYMNALRQGWSVILDNTNTSAKARRKWLEPARAKGYKLIAVTFPSTLEQLIHRQTMVRKDKDIPIHVIERMYNNTAMPLLSDFDQVIVDPSNINSLHGLS